MILHCAMDAFYASRTMTVTLSVDYQRRTLLGLANELKSERRIMRYVTAIALVLSAATMSLAIEPSSQQPTKAAVAPLRQNQAIEKAFISFRIGPPQWIPEDRYGDLLAFSRNTRV